LFWSALSQKKSCSTTLPLPHQNNETQSTPLEFSPDSAQLEEVNDNVPSTSSSLDPPAPKKAKTPAQDQLQKEIDVLNGDLVGLYRRRDSNILTGDQQEDLKRKKKELDRLEKQLALKKRNQRTQKQSRVNRAKAMKVFLAKHPEMQKQLKLRDHVGRPSLTEDQPELLKAIVDICMEGSAAHERRQSDVYRSIKTLDNLVDALKTSGFNISRSATYLRLLPKCSSTQEGKRHVQTVNVKLLKAQNDAHSKHVDQYFCAATLDRFAQVSFHF
jgi:hypothetical protein